nr:hypothetical protein BgiMline_001935 [Biomphalaria glabrata]
MQSGTLEGGTKIRAFVAGVETMGCGDKPDMADISRAFCNASRIDLVCSVTLLVLLMKPLFWYRGVLNEISNSSNFRLVSVSAPRHCREMARFCHDIVIFPGDFCRCAI